MKYNNILKFCAALRSGEYTQITDCLSRTVDGVRCHCALGVALETFGVPSKVYRTVEETGVQCIVGEEFMAKEGDIVYGYRLGKVQNEPLCISSTVEIDGIQHTLERIYPDLDEFVYELSCLGLATMNISMMNDGEELSFEEIADRLESLVKEKTNG